VRANVQSRRDYLLYAFELLTRGQPTMDKATWMRLYRALVPSADEQLVNLNWRVIDSQDRGFIGDARQLARAYRGGPAAGLTRGR